MVYRQREYRFLRRDINILCLWLFIYFITKYNDDKG